MVNGNENMQDGKELNNFGLPEGYFQKSAAVLMNKMEWQEEHKDYKLLLDLKNKHHFIVPPAYFETNAHKLELLEYPQLRSLKNNHHGFNVPSDYFEQAEVWELSKIMGEGEAFFGSATRENSFAVNEKYFQENEAKLKAILAPEKKSAKVIRLFSVRRIAFAAAVVLIALGFWAYDFYFNITDTKDCGTIACIDKTELLKAKAIENLETDELYELVNSKKLEENLKNNTTDKKPKEDSSAELKEDAMDNLLDGI